MSIVMLVLFLLFAALVYCALYIWSQFTYTFEESCLRIRWRLPGGIPFNTKTLSYDQITDIRAFSWHTDATGLGAIWGNFPSRRALVLVLSPRPWRRGFLRKYWLTPQDGSTFVEDLFRHGVDSTHST
jgi:hypothetical protein